MKPVDPNVLDPQSLAGLKRAARDGQPSEATLRQVASQFEALFMQMMLKSMREASFGDELFGGPQTEFYRDLYDQQVAASLARRQGLGLADLLVRQLGGARAGHRDPSGLETVLDPARLQALGRAPAVPAAAVAGPAAFVAELWPQAERAAAGLGIAPEAIVAVAALETGWGRAVIRHPDGRSAHNLFGIKAGAGWDGPTVTARTREFLGGVWVERAERFRAYDSPGASVADFAALLRASPRYAAALAAGTDSTRFFAGLARAGYASDPAYAEKLGAVLNGATLGAALAALKNSGDRPIPA